MSQNFYIYGPDPDLRDCTRGFGHLTSLAVADAIGQALR